ncbi:uncharacterized protein K02A2.6-like [Nematostella vectensis]|uniref:uncharacterized protein K02A2.6-like n=1 Tax=Nematostella vectensis TaxID=45351 RepID=UPI0020772623|nr:uncharacterized protein K02A2.6-like [Nematostella vectensis]
MKFTVETDHKPLVPLFTSKMIDELPVRIQRFRMRLMRYDFDTRHVLSASDKRLEEIRSELKRDDAFKAVMHYVQNGWPETKQKLYGPVKKYCGERGSLPTHEGLLMRERRLVIPSCLRPDILRYLHDGHQGISKTRDNAASSVWWPGISKQIEEMVRNCATCKKHRKERIEPMKGTDFPERPWSKLGADFFQHEGRHYLHIIDYYSRVIEIY